MGQHKRYQIPRIVIAGTGSGVGKTTLVVGLIQAFQERGLKVCSFKCGPDYLDPTYHTRVSGKTCHNLDSWMMGKEAVLGTFLNASQGYDLAVIEGVMGLFDGLSPTADTGSTAEIAKWLQAPVLAVIDAKGMARTIAAIAKGLAQFDEELALKGIIANFVGSEGHLALLKTALDPIPLVGGLPKMIDQAFPSRHLGLHAASTQSLSDERLSFWGKLCQQWLNLDLIYQLAKESPELEEPSYEVQNSTDKQEHEHEHEHRQCRIGVALDEAFHFYYEDNLRRLKRLGAELVFFSPLKDSALPQVDGLYLGGGYPELYAQILSENRPLIQEIKNFGEQGLPIYAECGGLMYLTEEIITVEGEIFPMVGLIPGRAKMNSKLRALGYVEVTTERPTLLGSEGLRFRGHQFRYSDLEWKGSEELQLEKSYRLRARRSKEATLEGYSYKNILASYVHAHWASNPMAAEGFVEACRRSFAK